MLVDSHCHLDYKPLNESCDAVVNRAREVGVVRMLNIGTTMKEFADVLNTSRRYHDVYCSIGVHPHHVQEEGEKITATELISRAADPKIVGIGETGLDYHYNKPPYDDQQLSFREHIRASITTGLPLIVHSRNAETETAKLLKEERAGGKLTGVLHCFSSGRGLAEEALEIGFYISLSGILTFKNSGELRAIARDVPMDRLLVETDSPYLAPEPHRGKPCEPAYVTQTAKILAEVKGVDLDTIEAQTTANFFRLFTKVLPL